MYLKFLSPFFHRPKWC